LFYMAIGLYFLYMITVIKRIPAGVFLLALTLVLLNCLIQEYCFVYRPETMVMCAGLASHYFLLKDEIKVGGYNWILSSVLAGLCVLTHLNGLIFIGAGVVFLCLSERFKAAFLYGLIASLISALYF